jgi:hypothetical protein
MKLDKTKDFATITGHRFAMFQQDGVLFDGAGLPLTDEKTEAVVAKDRIIESDDVASARAFLLNVLSGGPLSKAALFKVAEDNNQPWDAVKKAATLMSMITFTFNKALMWKLPEESTES